MASHSLLHRVRHSAVAAAMTISMATVPALAQAAAPVAQVAAPVEVLDVPTPDELEDLSAREAASTDLESFEGGEPVVVISSSALALALLIVILILILD